MSFILTVHCENLVIISGQFPMQAFLLLGFVNTCNDRFSFYPHPIPHFRVPPAFLLLSWSNLTTRSQLWKQFCRSVTLSNVIRGKCTFIISCLVLPWTKKRTIIEIRGEKNAVPRVISCSIRRDQRRASPIRDCARLLPCADRAWSSMISHVEQRSSRRQSRGWFFFLSRVVEFFIEFNGEG